MRKLSYTVESLGLITYDRQAIEYGNFGAIPPYYCDYCGPVWGEPESVCVHRGCGFESYWGPEPDEYEDFCPSCNRMECCGENQDGGAPFKLLGRYRHSLQASAFTIFSHKRLV